MTKSQSSFRACSLAAKRVLTAIAAGWLMITGCLWSASPPATAGPASLEATLMPSDRATQTPTAEPTATQLVPPSRGQIAFTCQLFAEGLYDQVCLIKPDGSGWSRLTTNDQADHFYPSLSPNGDSVLYSSNMHGPYEIYEQSLAGEPVRLTVQGENYAPAVSPDGSLIAYTHTDPTGAALWLMDRTGANAHYLVGAGWDATWSPDGAWILHASDRAGSIQLWRVKPDGTELSQITQFEGLRGRNDWSSQDLLATYAGGPWEREIITFDLSGESRQQITQGGNNLAPSFSPDGDWVAYTSYQDRYLDENGCEIYIQHMATATQFRLTENDYCDWQPRWGQ